MPNFLQGLRLGHLFYLEAVTPILSAILPELEFSAALIGSGSEVLGFDTEMSTDHHWGPRLMLFLRDDDYHDHRSSIDQALRNYLPTRFRGYPTNFTQPNPADNNVQLLQDVHEGPVNHRVELFTIREYFLDYLGFHVDEPIEPARASDKDSKGKSVKACATSSWIKTLLEKA